MSTPPDRPAPRALPPRAVLWAHAFTGFYRPGPADIAGLDPLSRFLYAARSVILVISAQAALIAGLLAAGAGGFHALPFAGVLVGLVVAHMLSNLSNDYVGFRRGHDTPDSPRMRYTVHPLAGGMLSRRTLVTGLVVLAVLGLGITGAFIVLRGWSAALFALAGTALLYLYDAAPVPLKSLGLGELAVFIVWGPLMIGGGYAMIAGTLPAAVLLAAVPYGLGVFTILNGKHIDQRAFDASRGLGTLAVRIGERVARRLNLAAIALMYGSVAAAVAAGQLSRWALLVAVALPRAVAALRITAVPAPPAPPAGYVGWPLWYHRAALVHNRLFGWAYVAGLALAALTRALGR